MCGLVGMAGKYLVKGDAEAFRVLLHLDVLRGRDSTGVGCVFDLFPQNKERQPAEFVVKGVGLPEDLYMTYPKLFPQHHIHTWGLNVAIGHNRWATQGKINAENAHPFDFDKIIGVHNGTVRRESLKGFHDADKYQVDSQIIFSHLDATKDLDHVWATADGAMALVWWDKEEKTLNFIRNKERSLFYALNKSDNVIYWASEDWMLAVAAARGDIKLGEIKNVEVNKHYKITLDNKIKMEIRDLPPFRVQPAPLPVVVGGNKHQKRHKEAAKNYGHFCKFKIVGYKILNEGRKSGYFIGQTDQGESIRIFSNIGDMPADIERIGKRDPNMDYYTIKAYTVPNSQDGFKWTCVLQNCYLLEGEDDDSDGLVKGWEGELISKEEYYRRTTAGCANCTGPVFWVDRKQIHWEDRANPVCPDCITGGYSSAGAYCGYKAN